MENPAESADNERYVKLQAGYVARQQPRLSGLSRSCQCRTRRFHSLTSEGGAPPADHDPALDNDDEPPAATGQPLRPEYDPSRPFMERIDAKVSELAAAGTPLSGRTLRGHVYAYRDQGVAGLVDGRTTREPRPGGRVDPARHLPHRGRARQTDRRLDRTKGRVITHVTLEAAKTGLPLPSRATLYRTVANLERGRHPFGDAATRRSLANRPDRTFGGRLASRPGELMEIDSTPLDLIVVYPDGTTGRPDLTELFDLATRTISATMLRAVATKSVDVAAFLLAKALTPLPMQPGWDASMTFSRSILPPGTLLDDKDFADRIAARPIIQPESITIDRGRVYVGRTFMAACERLQISVVKSAPRTPTDKPHIERLLSAINTLFVQYLAGYTGRSTTRKGKDPAVDAATRST